jgi:hypothetical protein
MKTEELLQSLARYAGLYYKDAVKSIEKNRHMNGLTNDDLYAIGRNEALVRKIVDAVIVDFINFIGAQHCADFAMYTKDLPDELRKSKERKTEEKTGN